MERSRWALGSGSDPEPNRWRVPMKQSLRELGVVGVGPQKTATSWLYSCLKAHPQLCFPKRVKETFFLDERWERGWDWYWSHFSHCSSDSRRAEIAPTLFNSRSAVERLRAHNPDCRIIVSLRDPSDRAVSLWIHHRKKGRVGTDFWQAVDRIPGIIDASHYATHLPRWIEAFGRERVRIVLQDDVTDRPRQVLEEMFQFLGLEPPEPMPDEVRDRINTASLPRFPGLARYLTRVARWLRERRLHRMVEFGKRLGLRAVYGGGEFDYESVGNELRSRLVPRFEEDVRYVEEVTGRTLTTWRDV